MHRQATVRFSTLFALVLMAAAAGAAGKTLDIYFIDTEGSQATLLVSPSGETFMIDVGFAGLDTPNPDKDVGRDAARIADVAKTAKVGRIDTLLVTHFHGDHASGIAHLMLPVRTFVDHGPALQDVPTMKQKSGEYAEDWAAAFANARHVVVAAGDRVSWTSSIGFQRQIGSTMALTSDFNFNGARNERLTLNNLNLTYNAATGLNYPFTDVSRRPIPGWALTQVSVNTGRSNYRGLETAFNKRMSNRYQYSVTYTLAGLWDDDPQPYAVDCTKE